jgi:hypothetical protein
VPSWRVTFFAVELITCSTWKVAMPVAKPPARIHSKLPRRSCGNTNQLRQEVLPFFQPKRPSPLCSPPRSSIFARLTRRSPCKRPSTISAMFSSLLRAGVDLPQSVADRNEASAQAVGEKPLSSRRRISRPSLRDKFPHSLTVE